MKSPVPSRRALAAALALLALAVVAAAWPPSLPAWEIAVALFAIAALAGREVSGAGNEPGGRRLA